MVKLFDLIAGPQVALAPGCKVIPASDLAQAIDAIELLHAVQADAKAFRQQVTTEVETIIEQAKKDGFEEGLQSWTENLMRLEQKAQDLTKQFEDSIVPIAITAAKKIVSKELSLDPGAIVDIVKEALQPVAQHKQFVFLVNKGDYNTFESKRSEFASWLPQAKSIVFRPSDDIQPGDCSIETEEGIIKVQAQKQWELLEHAFKTLMKGNSR